MKFLIDAQLPYRLKDWIALNGHDAIHTRDLPNKNKTKDRQIIELAEQDSRIIVTKDSDYLKHYILFQKPSKLIMITTGNIVNRQLILLFENNLDSILRLLEKRNVVELNNNTIIDHF